MKLNNIIIFCSIFFLKSVWAENKFVSLNLCTDRLLVELADVKQISSLSVMGFDENISLKKPNQKIQKNNNKLTELVPFINDTIIVNTTFSSRFYKRLNDLGFKTFGYNEPTTKQELITLINKISVLTNNSSKAKKLISKINNIEKNLKPLNKSALLLSENFRVFTGQNNNISTIIKLLKVKNSANNLSSNINLEKLISIKTDLIINIKYSDDFSLSNQTAKHPAIQKLMLQTPNITIPSKYTICFDHGIWQGAKYILTKGKPRL